MRKRRRMDGRCCRLACARTSDSDEFIPGGSGGPVAAAEAPLCVKEGQK